MASGLQRGSYYAEILQIHSDGVHGLIKLVVTRWRCPGSGDWKREGGDRG